MEVWTSTNTEQMSTTFIWIGVASVVGTLLIGPLFDRVNGMLLLSLCFLLESVSIALAPMWPNLLAFQALAAPVIFGFSAIFSGEYGQQSVSLVTLIKKTDSDRPKTGPTVRATQFEWPKPRLHQLCHWKVASKTHFCTELEWWTYWIVLKHELINLCHYCTNWIVRAKIELLRAAVRSRPYTGVTVESYSLTIATPA